MSAPLRLFGIAILAATAGCHYYADPPSGGVAPGTPVRIELDRPRTLEFAEAALRDIVRVEGPLLSWTPDSVLVSSLWVGSERGRRRKTLGEPVRFPAVHVAHVAEQRVHGARTAVLIAGGTVVAGSIFLALFGREDANGAPAAEVAEERARVG